MNFTKINSIAFSLLKKTGETRDDNRAEYEKHKTVKFTLPSDFPRTEEYIQAACGDMYKDLMFNAPEDPDSLGLWIEMDNITLNNSILLKPFKSILQIQKLMWLMSFSK